MLSLTELLHSTFRQISAIISDDSMRVTKTEHQLFNKQDCDCRITLADRLCFNPLGKFVNRQQEVFFYASTSWKVQPYWYVSQISIIFYFSMLLYYRSWMFYNHFIETLYHILGLTYWHSAQCQLLFFACFLLRRKSIPNGVQTQRNCLEILFGSEDIQRKKYQRGASRGAQPTWARLGAQVRPGGLCPPRWPPAPPLRPINSQMFQNPRW